METFEGTANGKPCTFPYRDTNNKMVYGPRKNYLSAYECSPINENTKKGYIKIRGNFIKIKLLTMKHITMYIVYIEV